MNVEEICKEIRRRLDEVHTKTLGDDAKPILLISEEYNGIWLEHIYDSVFYAMLDRDKLYLAEGATELFMSLCKPDGQLPYVVKAGKEDSLEVSYYQIQECVSFAFLCLVVYRMNGSLEYLKRAYVTAEGWVDWLKRNRMTLGTGLVEMFVGFDTGHDNSGRLQGMAFPKSHLIDGVRYGAEVVPECSVAPIIAVDMSCNLYSTLSSLSVMAEELGLKEESEEWLRQARQLKERLFEVCFDKDDCFFYDVDKNGNKRKYLSSALFHLFMEGVLDKEDDRQLIRELYERHISNPEEFATPYPYPSMAICDPSVEGHTDYNCWGYYSQGLIALRATLWMEEYGFDKELDNLCEKWVDAWTRHYDRVKLGQELDPLTGEPTACSEWYSSTMLFYLYAAKRLSKKIKEIDGDILMNNANKIPCRVLYKPLDPIYDEEIRLFQGCPTIAASRGGRLFLGWYAGGKCEPHIENYNVLIYSDDKGESWSKPLLIIPSSEKNLVQALDIQLWTDPDGRLHVFWVQDNVKPEPEVLPEKIPGRPMVAIDGYLFDDPTHAWWEIVCDDPDAEEPKFSEPRYIGKGFVRCKPLVTESGDWICFNYNQEDRFYHYSISRDKGESYEHHVGPTKLSTSFDECMAYQMKDGAIRVFARTALKKIAEFYSYDGGESWTDARLTGIDSANSRFYIARTPSGRILMANNDDRVGRQNMTLYLSEDDGVSWKYKCNIDERNKISYPDIDFSDGRFYLTYDRDRTGEREILFTSFTEEDIINGSVTPTKIISKPTVPPLQQVSSVIIPQKEN